MWFQLCFLALSFTVCFSDFTPCENEPALSVIKSMEFQSCPQTGECTLIRNTVAVLYGSFTPSVEVNSPIVQVDVSNGKKFKNIFQTTQICEKLQCPLQPGTKYSFGVDLSIDNNVPLGVVTFKGMMTDEGKKPKIACFLINATIVN